MIIRPYRDEDEAGVVHLWAEVLPSASPWNAANTVIAKKLTIQPELFFVAESDALIIGTVIAGYDGVRGWIHRLAVHPDHRRKGLATSLMEKAEAGLRMKGCTKLHLQVRGDNASVLAFYRSLGFHIEDRISLGKPLFENW